MVAGVIMSLYPRAGNIMCCPVCKLVIVVSIYWTQGLTGGSGLGIRGVGGLRFGAWSCKGRDHCVEQGRT